MTKFQDEKTIRRRHEDNIDHSKTCSYRYHGELCNRPASMSHGTKGEGPWFCAGHFRGTGPSKPHGEHWADTLVTSLINPEDFRRTGESKTAYRDRMMAKVRASLANMQKLPYDKAQRLEADYERRAIVDEYSNTPF